MNRRATVRLFVEATGIEYTIINTDVDAPVSKLLELLQRAGVPNIEIPTPGEKGYSPVSYLYVVPPAGGSGRRMQNSAPILPYIELSMRQTGEQTALFVLPENVPARIASSTTPPSVGSEIVAQAAPSRSTRCAGMLAKLKL